MTTQKAAEVSVDTKAGEIKVHHPWAAVDPASAMTFGPDAASRRGRPWRDFLLVMFSQIA